MLLDGQVSTVIDSRQNIFIYILVNKTIKSHQTRDSRNESISLLLHYNFLI